MIKIIKYGKKMRQVCPQCECEFEFEREDVVWGNQREINNCVKCPCCDKYITFDFSSFSNESNALQITSGFITIPAPPPYGVSST